MWPFPATKSTKTPENDPRSIESRMRALELDWEDTNERIRKVLQRISKRAEYVEKHEREESTGDTRADKPTPTPAMGRLPQGGLLSDRQKEIQHAILRRRAGG